MPTKAVQQFMLGTVLSNENEARRTLAAMKAAGYDKVMLWVFTNNVRARKFYESCGFVTYGKVKPCFETEEICYERKL